VGIIGRVWRKKVYHNFKGLGLHKRGEELRMKMGDDFIG
jgi:hypothetical protein